MSFWVLASLISELRGEILVIDFIYHEEKNLQNLWDGGGMKHLFLSLKFYYIINPRVWSQLPIKSLEVSIASSQPYNKRLQSELKMNIC